MELLDAVVLALEHMSRWKDASTACKAGPFMKAVRKAEFIVAAYVTTECDGADPSAFKAAACLED